MAKHEHLEKDRELELGVKIQARAKAITRLQAPNISEEEQDKLKQIVSEGDLAIEELVAANFGLVYSRARDFKKKYPGSPELEDLIQEGMAGLMTAVHKYDPARGNKFSTMAFNWIIQSIGRGVNKTHRMVRLPENRIADYSRITAIMSKYEEQNLSGSELDDRIREETGLSQIDIINIRNAANWHTSLNKKIGGESESRELGDVIGDSRSVSSAEYAVANNECFKILNDSISHLSKIHREIVSSHFNIQVNGEYFDSNTIKESYNLSPSKYRRLLAEGLKELKGSLGDLDLQLSDFLEP